MAITDFFIQVDTLMDYEVQFDSEDASTRDETSYAIYKVEVQEVWDQIKALYRKALSEVEEITAFRGKYTAALSVFCNIMQKIEKGIKKHSSAVNNDNVPAHSSFHLPPCDIEIFCGDYLNWPSFRDLFTAVYINNTQLSKVEKLFHLNAKTSGDAKEVVSKAALTNDGFDIAWQNLKQRFENKRILVNSQLRLLYNLPNICTESGEAIKRLQNAINNSISALKIHDIDVTNWDCILIFLCSTRLPELTLSLWEQSVRSKTELPRWEDFNTFLTGRYQTLETVSDFRTTILDPMINSNSASPSLEPNSKSYHTKPPCKLCPRQHHTIRNCPKFLNMMVGERENFIRRHGLCLNCFSKSHRVQHCNSSHNCYTCDRRHNTLLHYNPGPNNSANQFGSNFRRNYQDIRQSVASNSMQYSSNSNSAGTQLENRSGENFYSVRQDTNSSPVRSNPNSTANNSHSGQQKNFSVQIQNDDQQPTPHIVKANFGSISVSEEKALEKSFCERYFMTTKRDCKLSSPFEDGDSHGSTLENSRPSVHAQFLGNKSRSLRIPRNPISRPRSELSAPLLRDFSHHAPVHMKQFLRRFHPSNNRRVSTTSPRKP